MLINPDHFADILLALARVSDALPVCESSEFDAGVKHGYQEALISVAVAIGKHDLFKNAPIRGVILERRN